MKRVKLPRTELVVSQLCFGCWGIVSDFHWEDRSESDAIEALEAAFDAGVNYFDTAELYADGESEKLVGRVFADRRDQVVLATKIRTDSMKPDSVVEACERSLRRLGTDFIDLYQTHWTDPETPIADTWQAMQKLKQQGKVREISVCNVGVRDLDNLAEFGFPVTNQLPYNLLWRAIESEIIPKCLEHEIGVLPYSPLMHGMLADKFSSASDVPDGRARSRHFNTEREKARHGEPGCEEETFATIGEIRRICEGTGRTMADVSLAWLAAQPCVTSVIVGVRNASQLAENIDTIANPLSPETLHALDEATNNLRETLGPNPDMWQGIAGSRFH